MADLEARREARRQKILQNSENRMKRLLGQPDCITKNEEAEIISQDDGLIVGDSSLSPETRLPQDDISKSQAKPTQPVDKAPTDTDNETTRRITDTHDESPAYATSVRQRTAQTSQPSHLLDQSTLGEGQHSAGPVSHSQSQSFKKVENDSGEVNIKEGRGQTDPVRLLDLMRCGGCLLMGFLTRWALSFGLGILFLELVMVPFVILEISVYFYQAVHMKDIVLPHKSSMMAYALILSGVKAEIITKYNTIMGYVTAVMEDFALFLFSFLLSHAVMA